MQICRLKDEGGKEKRRGSCQRVCLSPALLHTSQTTCPTIPVGSSTWPTAQQPSTPSTTLTTTTWTTIPVPSTSAACPRNQGSLSQMNCSMVYNYFLIRNGNGFSAGNISFLDRLPSLENIPSIFTLDRQLSTETEKSDDCTCKRWEWLMQHLSGERNNRWDWIKNKNNIHKPLLERWIRIRQKIIWILCELGLDE